MLFVCIVPEFMTSLLLYLLCRPTRVMHSWLILMTGGHWQRLAGLSSAALSPLMRNLSISIAQGLEEALIGVEGTNYSAV